jgi:hypothetical protein
MQKKKDHRRKKKRKTKTKKRKSQVYHCLHSDIFHCALCAQLKKQKQQK